MDSANECFSGCARQHKAANMNGWAIPGVYLFRLYVCDKRNELTTSHRGDPTNLSGLFTFETARSETPDNIKSAHQRRKTAIKREECQQVTLKKCCTTGKSLSLATKWHPNKAEMNRLCALVKCLNHFKNILKKREVQSTLDRFLTSPLAKRQKPATEEEETYLE
jgi:hypothetical protein